MKRTIQTNGIKNEIEKKDIAVIAQSDDDQSELLQLVPKKIIITKCQPIK